MAVVVAEQDLDLIGQRTDDGDFLFQRRAAAECHRFSAAP